MSIHTIKLDNKYVEPIMRQRKLAEVRRNDREYRVGDKLQFVYSKMGHPRISEIFTITHILRHEDFPVGIKKGFCVISIKKGHDLD